jgi:hypothetical protein
MEPKACVATSRERHDGWTAARRERFLDCLASQAHVRLACAVVGLSPQSAYRLRSRDPAFAAGWEDALRLGYDRAAQQLLAALPAVLARNHQIHQLSVNFGPRSA